MDPADAPFWGLLGPERLGAERRTRSLGLSAAVRAYNDRAVPGMGGVWFGKQLLLATIGVDLARRIRDGRRPARSNIEVANAVEAFACWAALDDSKWAPDPRVHGALKMQKRRDARELDFATVRRRDFYVSQPMRMATVQPMLALGLVEANGERFNAFCVTAHGHAFLEAALGEYRPFGGRGSVSGALESWALGERVSVASSREIRQALSPLVPMGRDARAALRDRILSGNGDESVRRRAAWRWVTSLDPSGRQQASWATRPEAIDERHWNDLRAGAKFFALRDAAIAVLDAVEARIDTITSRQMSLRGPLPSEVADAVTQLRACAEDFHAEGSDPTSDGIATAFCREMQGSEEAILRNLAERDDRVIRHRADLLVPGHAFGGAAAVGWDLARSAEEEGGASIGLPVGTSHRVFNLFRMALDLADPTSQLEAWIKRAEPEGAGARGGR